MSPGLVAGLPLRSDRGHSSGRPEVHIPLSTRCKSTEYRVVSRAYASGVHRWSSRKTRREAKYRRGNVRRGRVPGERTIMEVVVGRRTSDEPKSRRRWLLSSRWFLFPNHHLPSLRTPSVALYTLLLHFTSAFMPGAVCASLPPLRRITDLDEKMGLGNLPYDLLLNITNYLNLTEVHALHLVSAAYLGLSYGGVVWPIQAPSLHHSGTTTAMEGCVYLTIVFRHASRSMMR